MGYDYLIFDTVNIGYQVFNHPEKAKENKAEFSTYQGKRFYTNFFKNYIETVEFLEKKFLNPDGRIILLYDNYESREELRELLKPLPNSANRRKVNPEYKSTRISQKTEFYNTLDILRYYYIVKEPYYSTARIPNLEADDLVPACITKFGLQDKQVLLLTNDMDWCRYLSDTTHYLPNIWESPETSYSFESKYGFKPTEGKIVLYKILWGDSSDNIDAVFPDMTPDVKNYVVSTFEDTQDFMLNANRYDITKEYTVMIKERELDIKLAYQMLSAIPVQEKHFNAICTFGRNSKMVTENIHKLVYGVTDDKNHFVFGMQIPRY